MLLKGPFYQVCDFRDSVKVTFTVYLVSQLVLGKSDLSMDISAELKTTGSVVWQLCMAVMPNTSMSITVPSPIIRCL